MNAMLLGHAGAEKGSGLTQRGCLHTMLKFLFLQEAPLSMSLCGALAMLDLCGSSLCEHFSAECAEH